MKNIETLKEILLYKKSTTKAQETFMEEFNTVYVQSNTEERKFLEMSIDQIFRKYYYSAVEPETYITPANIMSYLAEKESEGNDNTVFVPKVELIKKNGVLSTIKSSLHYVNSDSHYMITDFETVLDICNVGVKIDENGLLKDSERKKFKDKLFLKDNHYLNIIMLLSIRLEYVEILYEKNKRTAKTTDKAKELLNMKVKDKIELLAVEIIENFVAYINSQIPNLKDAFTNSDISQIIKNPSLFKDFINKIYMKMGINDDLIRKIMDGTFKNYDDYEDCEDDYINLENLIKNNPSFNILFTIMIGIDVYLFTPLGYYLQIIKPYYANIYNIIIEVGSSLNVLVDDYTNARNMLYSTPQLFDLTVLGEEVLLEGKKSRRIQEVSKKYSDESFLKCFEIREQYLEDELLNIIDSLDIPDIFDEDEKYYDDEEYLEEYNACDEHDNVIDLFDYKKKNSKSKKEDNLYVFKVKAYYMKTNWILVEILGSSTLDDLHEVIYETFELDWGHLYSFYISGKFWDKTSEYSHPDSNGRSADKIKIESLGIQEGSKFVYLYDYGAEMRFEIECRKIIKPENETGYPIISKKSKKFIELFEK